MTPLSVLSSVLYCFIISRFQCQWVRDVYPHFGRCFFNFDQLALTAGCHLPCLTPSGPVVVSLIGLGTGRGQEVAGGQIAILGCPPVTHGFRSMSIPPPWLLRFAVALLNPSSWIWVPECPPKIDQRSFCPQIGKLVDSQFKDLWDWLWEKHLERKSMFHLVEVVWVKSSSLWEPEALAVYHCRGRTSIQSLDKSHIGQEFRTTCTT